MSYLQGYVMQELGYCLCFRSETHGLNAEFSTHSNRNSREKFKLCGDECESMSHALWECPVYDNLRRESIYSLCVSLGGDSTCTSSCMANSTCAMAVY